MAIPTLPAGMQPYHRTVVFTETTIPTRLLKAHQTKEGAWAIIHVLAGRLAYRITDTRRPTLEFLLTPKTLPAVIEPTILHEVEPHGAVRFFVEFFRREPVPS